MGWRNWFCVGLTLRTLGVDVVPPDKAVCESHAQIKKYEEHEVFRKKHCEAENICYRDIYNLVDVEQHAFPFYQLGKIKRAYHE